MDIKVKDCNDCIFCGSDFRSSNPFTCLVNRKRIYEIAGGKIIKPEWCPLKKESVTVSLQVSDEIKTKK